MAARWDITDHLERDDSREPIEPLEPTENADRNDPTEPTDRAEPIDPIDRTEPLHPIERNESSDHNDHFDDEDLAALTQPSLVFSTRYIAGADRRGT